MGSIALDGWLQAVCQASCEGADDAGVANRPERHPKIAVDVRARSGEVLAVTAGMTTHDAQHRPSPEKPEELRGPHDSGTWDKVDEAIWESFPASDPPGHGPHEHVPEAKHDASSSAGETTRQKLIRRLGRELFQTEMSARLHCRREAERLGDVPPARPLLAASHHADGARTTMSETTRRSDLPLSIAGAVVGMMFSTARELVMDRIVSSELSYRGTL